MTPDLTLIKALKRLVLLLGMVSLPYVNLAPVMANDTLDRTGDDMLTSVDLPILLGELVNNPEAANILFSIADVWGLYVGPPKFNFRDYFPLAQNSHWIYVGFNGGSEEDNFTWTVEDTLQDAGGGKMATRIRTDTQEPTDDRNHDVDFWYCNQENGDVFYCGLHIGSVKGSGLFTLPIQDIVLTDPLKVGSDNMKVGVMPPQDSTTTALKLNTPFGQHTFNGTLSVIVNPTGVIPVLNTPLGNFTDVLRFVINITVTVYGQTYSFENSTFFLKKDVGMVAQDQQPDPNDAQIQGVQSGQVGGVTIVAH